MLKEGQKHFKALLVRFEESGTPGTGERYAGRVCWDQGGDPEAAKPIRDLRFGNF